jgi:hypothetical protein
MAAETIRTVTAAATMHNDEDVIVFNSAAAIDFQLLPALGDGRQFLLKNIGAGAVTLLPSGVDTIEGASSSILYTGQSQILVDYVEEAWFLTEDAPAEVVRTYYVDGSRSDSFAGDGSEERPYSTILAALTVINADSLDQQAASTYTKACYVVNVAPGTYSDNLTIGNVKNLRFNMPSGVFVTGTITYTTTMVGGTADNYYSRLEFVGVEGNRAEKGPGARLSGLFTATRNNDSLCYVSLKGVHHAGNMLFDTNGTWILSMKDVFFSGYLYTGTAAVVLLETTGHTEFGAYSGTGTGHISVPTTNAVVAVSLYNVDNTEFDLININNANSSRITNCRFKSDVTITGGTVYIDDISYKALLAITETLAGATLSYLDTVAANITPVARTNNPVVAANQTHTNIDLLDAAIGADPSPVARTTGPIAVANAVNANLDALDTAIGFEGQMSGTPHVVTFPTTIFQALDKLDTYKSVQTVKKTIGGVGVAGCDFNFATAANQTEQPIDLGSIIPARAKIMSVTLFSEAEFTGAVSLGCKVGVGSGGDSILTSTNMFSGTAVGDSGLLTSFAPTRVAEKIWVSATPGANWSNVTAGKLTAYVTFINVTNI